MKLSDNLLHECQRLLYEQWSKAFDAYKTVKAETNDGSPDWLLFHNEHLKNSKTKEDYYKTLLNEIQPFAPLTRDLGKT